MRSGLVRTGACLGLNELTQKVGPVVYLFLLPCLLVADQWKVRVVLHLVFHWSLERLPTRKLVSNTSLPTLALWIPASRWCSHWQLVVTHETHCPLFSVPGIGTENNKHTTVHALSCQRWHCKPEFTDSSEKAIFNTTSSNFIPH